MSTFKPILAKDLSKEELKLAVSSLTFLKQKINGDIKGISCADELTQRHTIKKEDTTFPTVSTEILFINSIFYPGERIHRGDQHHVPRQSQHHASNAEWEEINFKEYQTYQCKVFLCDRCDQQRRNVGGILSY